MVHYSGFARPFSFAVLLLSYQLAGNADAQFTTVINLPPDPSIQSSQSVGSNTQINLAEGGEIGRYFAAGAKDGTSTNIEINVSGGTIDYGFEANNGTVLNMSGGEILTDSPPNRWFYANSGSVINLSGGIIGRSSIANSGSLINVTGGIIGQGFYASHGSFIGVTGGGISHGFVASSGSVVTISDGSIGTGFRALEGSSVSISGGLIERDFSGNGVLISGGLYGDAFKLSGPRISTMIGNDFRLNNQLIEGLDEVGNTVPINVPSGAVLSGIFADGTPFAFTSYDGDSISDGVLQLQATELTTYQPSVINVSTEQTQPTMVRSGQTLNVLEGGIVTRLSRAAPGSTINIAGGYVDHDFEVLDSTVTITGGKVSDIDAFHGSTIDISGGLVSTMQVVGSEVNFTNGNSRVIEAKDNSHVRITGGTSNNVSVMVDSRVTVLNGEVQNLDITSGSTGDISGGFVQGVSVSDGGVINFTAGVIDPIYRSNSGVDSGGILNIAGGTITGSRLPVQSEGTLNVSGGHIEGLVSSTGNVNISAGEIQDGFHAGDGSVLDISGGTLGHEPSPSARGPLFHISPGATVRISGGSFGDSWNVRSAGTVLISGGSIGDGFVADTGSAVRFKGSEFRLDGVHLSDLDIIGSTIPIDVPAGSILTGVLTDGSSLVMSSDDLDNLADGTITLERAEIPSVVSPTLIVSSETAPAGLRPDHTLIVTDGGKLGRNFGALQNSTLIINGGTVEENLEVVDASVHLTDGSIGDNLDAFRGSTVTVSGGTIGEHFEAHSGSTVNILGGIIGDRATAHAQSTINISGGIVGNDFEIGTNSIINISGGQVGRMKSMESGLISISGGELDSLAAINSTVNISGGAVDSLSASIDSTVSISGGKVDEVSAYNNTSIHLTNGSASLEVLWNSMADIYGGTAPSVKVVDNGIVNLFDGTIGHLIRAESEGTVNVYGGKVEGHTFVTANGTLNAYGGVFSDSFTVTESGRAILTGGEFFLDGEPIADLETLGAELQLNLSASSVLSGTLADGSTFAFSALDGHHIADGTLTLHTVNLPSSGDLLVLPDSPKPLGGRPNQVVTVTSGAGIGNHFGVGVGGTLEINDGIVGNNLEVVGGTVSLTEGVIGDDLDIFQKAVVNVGGGKVGKNLHIFEGGTLNVTDGLVDDQLEAHPGSIVNIHGGTIGKWMAAHGNSTVNIHDGTIDLGFLAKNNSTVTITGGNIGAGAELQSGNITIAGGTFGDQLEAWESVRILGRDFRRNGLPIEFLDEVGESASFDFGFNDYVLSGVLADGTPFVFNSRDRDRILAQFEVIAVTPNNNTEFNVPSDTAPLGIHSTQTLNLSGDGRLNSNFVAGEGSIVNVSGGTVGSNFEAIGADVNITGGVIAEQFDAFVGSTINISGGAIGYRLDSSKQNGISLSVGATGNSFRAFPNSTIDISGGTIGRSFSAMNDSTVTIAGGKFGSNFDALSGSSIRILGAEFYLNGEPISGLDESGDSVHVFPRGIYLLEGVLADGTPILFSTYSGDSFDSGLTLEIASIPSVESSTIVIPDDPLPSGLRSGQTLSLLEGGDLGDGFTLSRSSRLIVSGGSVGHSLEVLDAEVSLSDGQIGDNFRAFHGTEVTISDGTVGDFFSAYDESVVNILGGEVGNYFRAYSGSTVNIEGGTVIELVGLQGSRVNISGGNIGNPTASNPSLGKLHINGGEIDITGGTFFNVTTITSSQNARISGGFFNDPLGLSVDSNISGGFFNDGISLSRSSTANISGGTIKLLSVEDESTVANVTGGVISETILLDGTLNLYGGQVTAVIQAGYDSNLNIFGTSFILDGVDLAPYLTSGSTFAISERDVTLTGLLLDGSEFSFDLSTEFNGGSYFFSTANVNITLVEPGDLDLDGDVDGADFLTWQRDQGTSKGLNEWSTNYGSSGFESGDFDLDGDVDGTDFLAWQRIARNLEALARWRDSFGFTNESTTNLTSGSSIPEPTTLGILIIGMMCTSKDLI